MILGLNNVEIDEDIKDHAKLHVTLKLKVNRQCRNFYYIIVVIQDLINNDSAVAMKSHETFCVTLNLKINRQKNVLIFESVVLENVRIDTKIVSLA